MTDRWFLGLFFWGGWKTGRSWFVRICLGIFRVGVCTILFLVVLCCRGWRWHCRLVWLHWLRPCERRCVPIYFFLLLFFLRTIHWVCHSWLQLLLLVVHWRCTILFWVHRHFWIRFVLNLCVYGVYLFWVGRWVCRGSVLVVWQFWFRLIFWWYASLSYWLWYYWL